MIAVRLGILGLFLDSLATLVTWSKTRSPSNRDVTSPESAAKGTITSVDGSRVARALHEQQSVKRIKTFSKVSTSSVHCENITADSDREMNNDCRNAGWLRRANIAFQTASATGRQVHKRIKEDQSGMAPVQVGPSVIRHDSGPSQPLVALVTSSTEASRAGHRPASRSSEQTESRIVDSKGTATDDAKEEAPNSPVADTCELQFQGQSDASSPMGTGPCIRIRDQTSDRASDRADCCINLTAKFDESDVRKTMGSSAKVSETQHIQEETNSPGPKVEVTRENDDYIERRVMGFAGKDAEALDTDGKADLPQAGGSTIGASEDAIALDTRIDALETEAIEADGAAKILDERLAKAHATARLKEEAAAVAEDTYNQKVLGLRMAQDAASVEHPTRTLSFARALADEAARAAEKEMKEAKKASIDAGRSLARAKAELKVADRDLEDVCTRLVAARERLRNAMAMDRERESMLTRRNGNILSLPDDAIQLIIERLGFCDRRDAAKTCHRLRSILRKYEEDKHKEARTSGVVVACDWEECMAGFAPEVSPRIQFTTESPYCGLSRKLTRVMTEQGVVCSWPCLEEIFSRALTRLGVHDRLMGLPMIIVKPTLPAYNKSEIEKILRTLERRFQISHFSIMSSAVAAIYASGRETGVLIECGTRTPMVVPVYKGRKIAIHYLGVSHDKLTKYMNKLFTEAQLGFPPIERAQMEECAYISIDFERERRSKSFNRPTNFQQSCGIRCGEALFRPALAGIDSPGVHEVTFEAIMACNHAIRQELLENIVVCAANGKVLRGFTRRLDREMNDMVNHSSQRNAHGALHCHAFQIASYDRKAVFWPILDRR